MLPSLLSDLSAAVALYRADFFQECNDDWALLERENLRGSLLWALEQLIVLYKQCGDYEQAVVYAKQLIAIDPLRESVHCELMRLYHLLGRDQAALEQYASLCQLLANELQIGPTTAATALYQEIAAAMDKADPVALPITASPPALGDLNRLPFVGRTEERTKLLEAVQAAVQGHGSVALIEGAAGVGKTRLVEEIIADAKWHGFLVGLGKADPLSAPAPYQPLCEALIPLLTPLRVAQLSEKVEPLWLSTAAPLLPIISELIPDLPVLPSLEPQQEQQRLWEGLSRFLVGLASTGPLLLVLEDLHRADSATLSVLSYLAPRFGTNHILLILTYRSAEARGRSIVWETLDRLDRLQPCLRIDLSPLGTEQAQSLVRRALIAEQSDPGATAFAQLLQERAQGNPLFLVEMLRSLLEQGMLVPMPGGGWVYPKQDQTLPTPDSIQELVGQRLIHLPPDLRAVVELVAVFGEDATFPLLSRASATTPSELADLLGRLCRRGFLTETESGYRSKHNLVQEVIYQAIHPRRRFRLHRQAGGSVEALHPDQVELLAFHAAAGMEWERAVRFYQAAGDRAVGMGATADAATAYSRALEVLDQLADEADPIQQFTLLLARERVYDLQGEREAQRRDLCDLANLVAEQGDDRCQAEVALRQAHYAEAICNYPQALAHIAIAVETIQATRDRVSVGRLEELAAEAYRLWGVILWLQGDPETAQVKIHRGLRLAQGAQLRKTEAACMRTLGILSYYQCEYAEAKAHLETVLPIFDEIGDMGSKGNTLNSLALVCHEQYDYAGAMPYYERALRTHRQIGDRKGEGMVLNNLGLLTHDQGEYTKAGESYQQALHIFREVGDRRGESMALNNSGRVFSDLGSYARARAYYEQALRIRRAIGQRRGEGVVLSNLGLLAHRQGDDALARSYGQQALQIAGELDDPDIRSYTLTYLGHALTGLGLLEEAAVAYQQSLDLRRELGFDKEAVDSLAGLTRVCLAQGHLDQAVLYTEEILCQLGNSTLDSIEEPFRVYLTCYRVLRATESPRADEILKIVCHALQERMTRITDHQMQRSFLENVACNREIMAICQEMQVLGSARRIQVRLPHINAPTGRTLREDEYVVVTWKVGLPEDNKIPGKVGRRRHRLLRLLDEAATQHAAPTIKDLATALDVSRATVKRDLAALRRAGITIKTRGRS
jgi:tetratricopeptide (TPR) repeat protein/biotin operon repressor